MAVELKASLKDQSKSMPRTTSSAGTAPRNAPRRFRTVLEPDHTRLRWVIARVPLDLAKSWDRMIRLRVRGEINGFAFRTSLFPLPASGGHFLLINRRMQTGAGVTVGMEAEIVLEPDLEERPSPLPAELLKAFEGDRKLLRYAEGLSESIRREIGKWIGADARPEVRIRRAKQMAERLLLTMNGERETPPVLEMLFREKPAARAGWKAMTEVQRRSHLLGIFYYRTPDGRRRRAEKASDDALGRASKS